MDKNSALILLASLIKGAKLTEDERNDCYKALSLLDDLSQLPKIPISK